MQWVSAVNKMAIGRVHRRESTSVKHGTERITTPSGKNYFELVTATGCHGRIVDAQIRTPGFLRLIYIFYLPCNKHAPLFYHQLAFPLGAFIRGYLLTFKILLNRVTYCSPASTDYRWKISARYEFNSAK